VTVRKASIKRNELPVITAEGQASLTFTENCGNELNYNFNKIKFRSLYDLPELPYRQLS
jgi:hypothetical protein